MRVVCLTGFRSGAASRILPLLVEHPSIEVGMVILREHVVASRRKSFRRRIRKLRKIGPLGALTGLYLRTWQESEVGEDLFEVAERHGVPVEITPRFNGKRTRELVRQSGADLGLTLGTAIIKPSVFEIPRLGMVNVHGDVLPRFRGSYGVIWPIYEGVAEAGFTVHQIDAGIDTGAILHIERFPIDFKPTLKDTYRANVAEIERRVPAAMLRVLGDYERFRGAADVQQQGHGTTYTTPTFWQFLRMLRRHREFRRSALSGRG